MQSMIKVVTHARDESTDLRPQLVNTDAITVNDDLTKVNEHFRHEKYDTCTTNEQLSCYNPVLENVLVKEILAHFICFNTYSKLNNMQLVAYNSC